MNTHDFTLIKPKNYKLKKQERNLKHDNNDISYDVKKAAVKRKASAFYLILNI